MRHKTHDTTPVIPGEIALALPPELPISRHAEEIERALARNQVIIVAGDTGSGKTTQLPKILLRAGLGRKGIIGHTQPRRLAAVSVAGRIAGELGVETGGGVGVQVRFDQRVSAGTYLKLMTDGILLAEIQRDRLLRKYQALIIDEAHERSLNIDFLLGYLKLILPKRQDLKLVITSATLDVERIAAHFGKLAARRGNSATPPASRCRGGGPGGSHGTPIIRVAGRGFPVRTQYLPPEQLAGDAPEEDRQMAAIAEAVSRLDGPDAADTLDAGGAGDILVFLSSEKEIRETAAYLRRRRWPGTEILPLYSRLRSAEQQRIFAPHGSRRRIVLSTNVAETSLTVPGIRYVIDVGQARVSRYSLQRKLLRLPIEPISRASADQRKGRCGRLASGVCIRLYSERDYLSRPEFTDPEIRRSNLAQVILRMSALGLGQPEAFPFLDAPGQKSINDGRRLLRELGALTGAGKLTRSGRMLAELPLEPQLGRMLVTASRLGSLREVLIIVAALSLGDLWEAAPGAKTGGRGGEFSHPESDFLGLLKLWERCETERSGTARLRKFCGRNGLSFQRVREWREIHRQLLASCRRLGCKSNRAGAGHAEIHRALVSGFLNQIARHHDGKTYLGSRNRKFTLAPASALARKNTPWILTNEWIDTERTFATMAARIKPEWAIEFAGPLLRKEYGEPFWSGDRQQVMVHEKTMLYGLALKERNPVDYGKLDPAGARDVFLDHALLRDQIRSKAGFIAENRAFLGELRKQEEKFRRPELIVNEREIHSFYERRIPADVFSTRTLESWLAEDPQTRNRHLEMRRAGLFRGQILREARRQFPDRVELQNNVLPVDYVFEPGAARDGVSLKVPAALLAQLTQADIDWAVPGLIRDKCVALIRGLPKKHRRKFIPAPDFIDRVLPEMGRADGELVESLLRRMNEAGGGVEKSDLFAVELPAHLQTRLQVLDQRGQILGESADLVDLRKRFAGRAPPPRQHPLAREGMRDWEIGDLPESAHVGGGVVLLRYPALVDEGDSVALRLMESADEAAQASRQGAMRLFMLRSTSRRNALRKQFLRFRNANAARIFFLPGVDAVEGDAVAACYREAFGLDDGIPRSRPEFEQSLEQGGPRLAPLATELERLLVELLDKFQPIRQKIAELPSGHPVRADIEGQLGDLLCPGFVRLSGFPWLRHFPRYLDGILLRLEKSPHFGSADAKHTRLVAYYRDRFEQLRSTRGDSGPLRELRWSVEELRISLFAQRLGTSFPVSRERLDKRITALMD